MYAKDSTSFMYITGTEFNPGAAAFDNALSADSTGAVIDITDYVNGDNDVLFFAPYFKTALRIGGLQSDKSYISWTSEATLSIPRSKLEDL